MQAFPDTCLIDLTGQKFDHLRVRGHATAPLSVDMDVMWSCTCICGKTVDVAGGRLRQGLARSCGCEGRMPAPTELDQPQPRARGSFLRTFFARALNA